MDRYNLVGICVCITYRIHAYKCTVSRSISKSSRDSRSSASAIDAMHIYIHIHMCVIE
jgi:hypothetical protein